MARRKRGSWCWWLSGALLVVGVGAFVWGLHIRARLDETFSGFSGAVMREAIRNWSSKQAEVDGYRRFSDGLLIVGPLCIVVALLIALAARRKKKG